MTDLTAPPEPDAPPRPRLSNAWRVLATAAAFGVLFDASLQSRAGGAAALGAIGHPDAIEPLLEFIRSGPAQVRRRAIAAITVFDDPRIEPAIRKAALDRNPGVKEAAEMVVGRQIVET